MTKAFDRVEAMFSDIELFIQLYPGDKNIEKASTNLIASTLFAAENVLGFFMKGTCRSRVLLHSRSPSGATSLTSGNWVGTNDT